VSSSSRCAATNGPILEELAALRHERATLLGFPSHAAFMLAPKMAATPAAATALLSDVRSRLAPLRKEELARLKEIKAEREGLAGGKANGAGPPSGGSSAVKLDEWDTAVYVRLLKERDYSIDQEEVRQYFPLPRVKRQIFSLFEKLLHVKIRRVVKPSTGGEAMAGDEDEDEEGDAEEGELSSLCWHEDVELYVIREAVPSEGGGAGAAAGEVVGHFFLDLHPRPGKYGHQCVLPIAPAFTRHSPCASSAGSSSTGATGETGETGETGATGAAVRVRPACAILGNMTKPPSDGSAPALLRFDEVSEDPHAMHEFGHVVHGLSITATNNE
jgi:thimet oligopeptidase